MRLLASLARSRPPLRALNSLANRTFLASVTLVVSRLRA
jgi:hypothetical protein